MPKQTTTDQQRRAIEAQGVSVVLSSGAGCGKTTVLTERFLKHLADDGAEVSQVVAITFTERAAREMRDRIRRAIQAHLKSSAGDSAARWKLHLRNLESATISTIHSFCGNILRQHALAAGLDPRFEILEEVLAGNLRAESLRSCLQDLLPNKAHPAGEDLRKLVVEFGWFETVQAIRHLAYDPDPLAWKDWLGRPAEQIEREWLGGVRDRLRPGYVEYLVAADAKIASCLNLIAVTPCTVPEMKANVARLLAETPALGSVPNLATAVAELKELAKVGKWRAKAWDNDEQVYAVIKDAFEDYRDAIVKRLAPFTTDPENVLPAIQTGQRFIRVALEVAEEYQRRKQRAAYLDFQDLLVMSRDLVRDQEEVRQALRERYRFILLDEMQDTDPVQMELILSLCTPVEVENGKLFAVGDHKQSIYRFRGAEVRLFRELRERVPERGRLDLTRNFRSQSPILDFVNALCSRRVPHYEPLEAGASLPAKSVSQSPTGEACVEFLWSQPPDRAGKQLASDIRRREAGLIAQRLKRLIDDGIPRIWDKQEESFRAVKMEDVVLLFRSMSNVALYEEALRRHGLDYYLVGGRAFFAQQEIYDLYRLLRSLENPDDSLSLTGALRSPFCCLSDETLFILNLNQRGKLWKGLHDDRALAELPIGQKDAVLRARVNLEHWRGLKDRLPIVRLIGEIFADSGYDAAMQFEFLGDRKLANLWKLQDLARTFDRSGNFGLADFVQRLGELVRDQPREEQAATMPEKADVVKLMSIHQAKGLEFPVVVVPDMAAPMRASSKSVARWDRELGCLVKPPEDFEPPPFSDFGHELGEMRDAIADWAEDLRILYVACTRAEDLLILSAGFAEPLPETINPKLPLPLKSPNTWMTTIGERFNLRSGDCIASDVSPEKRPRIRVEMAQGVRPAKPSAEPKGRDRPALESATAKAPTPPRPRLPGVLMLPTLEWLALKQQRADQTGSHVLDGNQPEQFERIKLSEEERLFREILTFWDARDPNDWKSSLEICVEQEDSMEAEAAVDTLERWFQTFTASELFEEIRQAEYVTTRLEFLLTGPDLFLPPCRGWIDLLVRDRAGLVRLVEFHSDPQISLKEAAKRRRPFLALQAEAFWQQTGARPVEADLFDLEKGTSERINLGKAEEGWQMIGKLLAPLRA